MNTTDLGILAAHYGQTLAGGASVGDFNLDGNVNVNDLYLIEQYFNQPSGSGESFADALAMYPNLPAVPEPTALALMTLLIPMLTRRVRRAT